MKKLLLFSFLVMGISNVSAQGLTCATATAITADGLYTSPAITGTYVGTCAPNGNVANPNAMWWSYTATADGEVTLNSDLFQATGNDDTRVSVFTGTCAALVCYAGSDDVSGDNYLTTLTFPVQSGTTYYIQWDDRWSALGFDFDFLFAVVDCVMPNAAGVTQPTNITTTNGQLNWAVGIGNPASYDVEYGPVDFAQGTGTVVNSTTNSVTVSGAASTVVDYYLRNNCGASQSVYVGPFSLYLAVTLPYSNDFDDENDLAAGFLASGWSLTTSTTLGHSGQYFYFSNASTTAAVNHALYSRAIALQANEQVTVTFWTRLNNVAGSAQTLKVWFNNALTLTGATQAGADISVSGNVYVQQTRTFTAPTAGTYYVIMNNASPAVTTNTNMFLDTVAITSVLANDQFLASSFNVYPNPANNFVTISNTTDALVNGAEIVDMNGRVVKSQKVANVSETQINVSDLANGVYMMNISTDRGSLTKKLVIE
ncbi:T9SS type A sorting domain-containing protein [Flavobacterium terrisoli]|uniref:T9SS type A sorting domain-containing protein n=1 Tax=Flavobacterium terrisoli TaxID=3242195 RepID=UPI00254284B3|nr:T9SS type A sorting domain-containing protein [Flavobacterium buctense]